MESPSRNCRTVTVQCGSCGKEIVRGASRLKYAKQGKLFCNPSCFYAAVNRRIVILRKEREVLTHPESSRMRARRKFKNSRRACDVCGKLPSQIHHKDRNPFNNDPSNIAFLCPYHHYHTDRVGLLESIGCKGGNSRAQTACRDHRGRFIPNPEWLEEDQFA